MEEERLVTTKGTYDEKKKHFYIESPITEFVPSYAYYVCENLEHSKKIKIKTISFLNSKKIYRKENLKHVYDWSDVK